MLISLNKKIHKAKLNNYNSLKIPINHFWNLEKFEQLLQNYPDKEIIQFVRYGWPISHNGKTGSHLIPKNWGGATNHIGKVKEYLKDEIAKKTPNRTIG